MIPMVLMIPYGPYDPYDSYGPGEAKPAEEDSGIAQQEKTRCTLQILASIERDHFPVKEEREPEWLNRAGPY